VFGPDDLEDYSAVRDRLRLHIVAWARRRGIAVEPSLVAAALDHKHSVDGRLGHWTRRHVADALAVWFPRTVALLDGDRDAVPAALHALVGFLAERDWLDAASATPAQLHAQIDDSTPALHDALGDERNRDLGTFWAVQLRRHGVAAADPAAVAGAARTTLVFAVRNVPGSLHRSLGAFATRGLNLSRLESRPWTERGSRWEYLFWVDLDGDPGEPACAAALEALRAETEVVRILGTYPRASED